MLAEGNPPETNTQFWYVVGPPLVIILIVFYLMDSPRRREQSRRDQMLKNMKKNDRVSTIGGILGTVVNISTDGKEVTLKVDDNTRIRFRRSAIADVFADEAAESAAKPG